MSIIFPTLNYVAKDYLNDSNGKTLSLTFTRATSAYRSNSIGLLESVSSGILRHDYDSVTGEYKGWIAEESRTNELLYSESANNASTIGNITISSNSTKSPGGTNTADTMTDSIDASPSYHYISHGYSQSGGTTTRCFSSFVKAGPHDKIRLTVGGNSSGQYHLDVNLTSATVAATSSGGGAVVASGIYPVGDGWYRAWIAGTLTAGDTAAEARVVITNTAGNTTYQGAGALSVYIWGRVYETGTFPTSYIQTTTSSVTRNTDVLSISTSSFGFNPLEGTLLFIGDIPDASNRTILALGTTATTETIEMNIGGGIIQMSVKVSNVSQASISSGSSPSINTKFSAAIAYKVNDFAICVNGGSVSIDSSGNVPIVDTLYIGANYIYQPNVGHIRHIAYFPRRLSNSDLQSITT